MSRRLTDSYPHYYLLWSNQMKSGQGKFWKRKHNKAARKAARMELFGFRPKLRTLSYYASQCNYKNH